jgi:hypothetical protein
MTTKKKGYAKSILKKQNQSMIGQLHVVFRIFWMTRNMLYIHSDIKWALDHKVAYATFPDIACLIATFLMISSW